MLLARKAYQECSMKSCEMKVVPVQTTTFAAAEGSQYLQFHSKCTLTLIVQVVQLQLPMQTTIKEKIFRVRIRVSV